MNRLQRIVTPTLGLVLLTIGPACSQKDIRSSDSGGKTDTASVQSLRRDLERIRNHFPGDMSIYMKNLSTAEEIAIDPDTMYETFSVIKLAIAAELMHQVESGKLSLSDRITTKAADERLPSGVLYALEPGLSPTIKDSLGLANTSIQFSDLDWDRTWLGTLDARYRNARGEQTVNFPFSKYSQAQVEQAFGHTIYDAGIFFGHSTTKEIGRLLEMMASGKLVSKDASELILNIMEKQQVNDRFPRYLKDVRIAHKTGDGQPFIANDVGIIWVKDQPIVLVVFTGHHCGGTAALHDAVARVAALVVRHYGGELSSDFE